MEHDLLHSGQLLRKLTHAWEFVENDVIEAIRALGTAALIYADLADATIDANILTRPLASAKWFRRFQQGTFRHAEVISIISYNETGIHNIDPELLGSDIAVSHADSLYVPSTVSNISNYAQTPYAKILVDPRSTCISHRTGITFPRNSWEHTQTRADFSVAYSGAYDTRD